MNEKINLCHIAETRSRQQTKRNLLTYPFPAQSEMIVDLNRHPIDSLSPSVTIQTNIRQPLRPEHRRTSDLYANNDARQTLRSRSVTEISPRNASIHPIRSLLIPNKEEKRSEAISKHNFNRSTTKRKLFNSLWRTQT